MSIKKSQAILKHFIDLKFSVWFMLCWENETIFLGHLSPIYTAENFWRGSDEKRTRTKKIGSARIDLVV